MHARAAGRLESLGFGRVFRYAPGKADWRGAGLPMEGSLHPGPRAIDVVRREVPTCALDASVEDARSEAARSHCDFCLVVGDGRLVLGRLRQRALNADPALLVTDVMENGPTTIRADEDLAALTERMRTRHVTTIIVSDPDGRLIGVLYGEDGEQLLATDHRPFTP
jgi:predicted transcriptional regulator